MNIRKRTGEVVPFQEEKILNAMKKAFSGQVITSVIKSNH